MSEIIEIIETNANEARAREEDLMAKRIADKKLAAQIRRQKALRALIVRVIACVVIVIGLWVASTFDLIAVQLSRPLVAAVFVYLAFWAGAWCQFAWCKGGLLE